MVIFQALNENSDILMSQEISLFAMHDLVTVVFGLLFIVIGSLSNHDDDGNKNPTNLHI